MKIFIASLAVLGSLSSLGQAQQPALVTPPATAQGSPASPDETPAQQRIAAAERQIQAYPKKVQAYNDLAIAYLRRTRETSDAVYLEHAEQALKQGAALDPKDFQLQKTQISLLLAQHQYSMAKEKATPLNRRTPDDVMTYGYLAEADLALGNYAEAEQSVQWMLNMLPNNVPGLLLGAKLRAVLGDPDGAVEFLNLAYTETSPTEVEELAWIANQIASVQIASGKDDAAEQILDRAEQLFPHYPYTTENLARVRLAQHRAPDAVALLLKAKQAGANPHLLYELAAAQSAAGEAVDSRATYADFQRLASKREHTADNADCDLILFYSGDPATAPNALILAQHAIEARHDVWTRDAYALALYANGKFAEADATIQKAIAVGVQSAQIFNHAGHIALKVNHQAEAAKDFELSMRVAPGSNFASDSRRAAGLTAGVPVQAASAQPVSVQPVSVQPVSVQPVSVHAAPVQAAAGTDSPAQSQGAASNTAQVASQSAVPTAPPVSSVLATPPFSPVPSALLVPHATDTDRVVHKAQSSVARNPKDAVAYSTLGAAYFQRARETGDVSAYQLAEESLTKSLDLVSADFSADAALGTMAEVCMGEHRFTDALIYAQKALSLGSGDVSPFAIIGDAHADMGEYEKAKLAYARLTPPEMTLSSRAAYARDSRLAYLKFVVGDTPGAIALMKTSVAEGTEAQLPSENLAWLYFELGEFYTQAGDTASADTAYLAALSTHPGDYRALAGLGKLRGNQGKYEEAIVLYQKAIAVVPMPIFVAELGDLHTKSGNPAEAKKQFQLVEYMGLLGHINQVLHNRDLAIFYADHDIKLTEALTLAHKEFEVRHDIYTWDALSWALYKNGKYAEAEEASRKALQFGTRDSLLLFHAGMISEKLGQRDQATHEYKQALQINPHFHRIYSDVAQQRLALLATQTASNGHEETRAQ